MTVMSPLNSNHLLEADVTAGAAAKAAEGMKNAANDQKCSNLGWACAIDSHGTKGKEAQHKHLCHVHYLSY